jgi:hypothetical protein
MVYKGINFVCHFFCVEEMEWDITPKQINNIDEVKVVLKFIETMSKMLRKNVAISYENDKEIPLIILHPNGDYATNY